jgi:enolase
VRQTGVNATSSADVLDPVTVLPYLRERGLLHDDTACRARELTGGVSERAGLAPGDQVAIAVDVAATQLHDGELYLFDGGRIDGSTLLDTLEGWCTNHPLVSIEDPLAEDDWAGWAEAERRLGDRVQLVGDDLFATNVDRRTRGITEGVANAILVKPNNAGP